MNKVLKRLGLIVLYMFLYFLIFQFTLHFCFNILERSSFLGIWLRANRLGSIIVNDLLAFPIFALVVFFIKKKSIFKVSLFSRINYNNILLSIIIGIMMGIFVFNFFGLSFCRNIPVFQELLIDLYNSKIVVFTGFVLIGTFFKEILFRGLIYNELEKTMPLYPAILLHALIYGGLFFAFNVPLTLFSILGNIVFVLVYIYTRSIWSTIIAQIMNNITIYIIQNYVGDIFNNFRIPSIIISVGIIILSLYFINRSKNSPCLKHNDLNLEVK